MFFKRNSGRTYLINYCADKIITHIMNYDKLDHLIQNKTYMMLIHTNIHDWFICLNLYYSIMDKVLENLITSLAGLAIGYSIAEGYKQFVSHSAKKSWEDDIGIHHGEAGIALFGAGSVSSAFLHGEKIKRH